MFQRTGPIDSRLVELGVNRRAAHLLSLGGTLIDLPAGTTLCQEGERGTQAFLILEGTATVQLGDRDVSVGPGDVIGEIATLDPALTRNATVVADVDVLVLVYDPRSFRALAQDEALRPRLTPQRGAA